MGKRGGKREFSPRRHFLFLFSLVGWGYSVWGGSIFGLWAGAGNQLEPQRGGGGGREGTAKMPVSFPFHEPKSLIRLKRKLNIENKHLRWKKNHIRSKNPIGSFLRPKSLDFWAPCSPDFCCSMGPHKPTHAIETSRKRRKEKRRRRRKEWAWRCKRIGSWGGRAHT